MGVGNGIVDDLLSHGEPGALIESTPGPREDTPAITNRNTRLEASTCKPSREEREVGTENIVRWLP